MKKVLTVTSKDCIFQTFSVGGPGGGGKDTGNSGVRWIHPPSGAVGEGREERRQDANKREAWKRMAKHPKMVKWLETQSALKAGMSPTEMMTQFDRFRDYHTAKGSRFVNWPAAWRTWCGNYRPNSRAGPLDARPQTASDYISAELRKYRNEPDRHEGTTIDIGP
jgi:hypothetical protein